MRSFQIPLLWKLMLALALVGLLPFLVVAFQTRGADQAMIAQTHRTHQAVARGTASQVRSYLDLLGSIARFAVDNPNLFEDPGSLLRGLLEGNQKIIAAGIYLMEGESATLVQRAQNAVYKEDISQLILADDPRELIAVDTPEGLWVRLRQSIAGEQPLALLLVASFPELDEMLRPRELGDQADLVLATCEGQTIGGLVPLEDFPKQLRDVACAGQVEHGAGQYLLPNGGTVIGAYADVEATPWYVLSKQPESVAKSAADAMRRLARKAFLWVFLVAAGLSLWAYFRIVRPIRHLVRAQRRLVGAGTGTVGGGEIEQLQDSFALLEQHMHDREALSTVFLGRYQVVDVLGVGAMGTVFRGHDPRLQRPVALKTFKVGSEELTAEDRLELSERLVQEAVTLARLQHPNIVTVFDALQEGDAAFIAMELVEGVSLESYLHQEIQLPPEQVMALGAAVSAALVVAHEHEIVHHDIKPANILLGDDGSIKVTDFGIAELISNANKTREVVCGTPGYLPPETLQGQGFGKRSDLFALGVVLYQCLVGRRPFDGRNPKEVMVETLLCKVVDPARLRMDIPRELADFVLSLLAKEVDDRPENALEVIETLKEMAGSNGLQWAPEPFLKPMSRKETKHDAPNTALLPTRRVRHG